MENIKISFSTFWENMEYLRECEEIKKIGEFEKFLGLGTGSLSRIKKEQNLKKYDNVLKKLTTKYGYPAEAFFKPLDKTKADMEYRTKRFLMELKKDTRAGKCLWTSEGKFTSEYGDIGDKAYIKEKLEKKKLDLKQTELWSAEEERTKKILYITKTEKIYNLFLKVDDGICEICDGLSNKEFNDLMKELHKVVLLYRSDLLPEEEKVYRFMGDFLSSKSKL